MIIGATLGTTSTLWMLALFGFRVSIAAAAKPILGVGASLWVIATGRTRSFGAVLAGFGLIFIGIEYLQTGMAGVAWDLEAFAGRGPGSQWILAGIGVVMAIAMQSSSAAADRFQCDSGRARDAVSRTAHGSRGVGGCPTR